MESQGKISARTGRETAATDAYSLAIHIYVRTILISCSSRDCFSPEKSDTVIHSRPCADFDIVHALGRTRTCVAKSQYSMHASIEVGLKPTMQCALIKEYAPNIDVRLLMRVYGSNAHHSAQVQGRSV